MKKTDKPMPKMAVKKSSKPMPKLMVKKTVVVKKDKPVRTIPLAEVKVTATRLKKAPEAMVRLSPFGEAKKSSVDSLKRVGYGRAIGEAYKRGTNERSTYGPESSDVIKKALNLPKTKKKQ